MIGCWEVRVVLQLRFSHVGCWNGDFELGKRVDQKKKIGKKIVACFKELTANALISNFFFFLNS